MAKKNKKHILLEDVELKPQVIGYTYKKKSNLGRVIFIFIALLLVVYYINDISAYINKLIGRNTAETIENLSGNNNNNQTGNNKEKNEINYYVFDNNLEIKEEYITLNNFRYIDKILSFDIITDGKTDLNNKKFFIETYTENKTLIERYKLDVNNTNNVKLTSDFYYIALEEKTIDDYPVVILNSDDQGIGILNCVNNLESVTYTFKNNELESIKHTITNSNTTDANYYSDYNNYQIKATNYNQLSGFNAVFNGGLNGYSLVVDIDLQKAELSSSTDKYYYGYKEVPKVVKFEMETYGFKCN